MVLAWATQLQHGRLEFAPDNKTLNPAAKSARCPSNIQSPSRLPTAVTTIAVYSLRSRSRTCWQGAANSSSAAAHAHAPCPGSRSRIWLQVSLAKRLFIFMVGAASTKLPHRVAIRADSTVWPHRHFQTLKHSDKELVVPLLVRTNRVAQSSAAVSAAHS